MGKIKKKDLSCLDTVNCKSSDARQLYEDGTSFCFSCKTWFPKSEEDGEVTEDEEIKPVKRNDLNKELEQIAAYGHRGFAERKVEKLVAEYFGVKVSYGSDGKIDTHYYPYENGKAYKRRYVPTKKFNWIGKSKALFGKELFNGGGRRVIVVEGEIDCLSIAQASQDKYKKIYPVVSISSATWAPEQLLANRDWLRSFSEIIICFDEDDAGEDARKEAIKILGLDKVKITKLPRKDANEVLVEDGSEALMTCIFNAAKYIPSGIISTSDVWKAIVEYSSKPSIPYPPCFGGITSKTKGMRLGEISLFTSGTSCGKSTMLREIALHIIETVPGTKVGICSLEESPAETGIKFAAMQLKRNPADVEIPLDELQIGFDNVFRDDRLMLVDHQGSLKDESIIDKLEYLALSGCQYIVIDHVTILVSEGAEGLTGNEAIDKVMNDLLRFVKRHNVWVGLVSHLRKTPVNGTSFEGGQMPTLDDIKGSGSIKQVSFDIIAFARNLMEDDVIKRNTISAAVLKCRFTGLTGRIPGAYYDFKTGRFLAEEDIPSEEFHSL